jgi:polysaccharide export outer membrane protein
LKPYISRINMSLLTWGLGITVLVGCASVPSSRNASAVKRIDTQTVEERMVMPTKELHKGGDDQPVVSNAAASSPAQATPAATETQAVAPAEEEKSYVIGPGDRLSFRFFDDESLSVEAVVRYDGCISLPLIPDVKVAGVTREEAADRLKKAYSALFQEPQLSLAIIDAGSKTFAVMGDVSMPGEFPYLRPITLLDGINAAGGMRVYSRGGDSFVGAQGQLLKALVIRHKGEAREVMEFDLRGMKKSGSHTSDTPVYPGDIIYVPESVNLVYVLGEVRGPGVFAISEGTTLLQILARAGSFQEATARMHHLVLMRETDSENTTIMLVNLRHILKKGGDFEMVPGDVIYLPRKPLVNLDAFVTQFTGSISPVLGLYRQAWDAYYTKKTFDRMFQNVSGSQLLAVQQGVSAAGAATGTGLAQPVTPTTVK